jgi:hypothetical protein
MLVVLPLMSAEVFRRTQRAFFCVPSRVSVSSGSVIVQVNVQCKTPQWEYVLKQRTVSGSFVFVILICGDMKVFFNRFPRPYCS